MRGREGLPPRHTHMHRMSTKSTLLEQNEHSMAAAFGLELTERVADDAIGCADAEPKASGDLTAV